MIAIFPDLLGLAATGNAEEMAEAVAIMFGPDIKKSSQRGLPFLNHVRQQVGIGFHRLEHCPNPCILTNDDNGSFRVTILAASSLARMPAFTLAHLIGHFFMELQLDISRGGKLQKGLRESVSPSIRYLNTNFKARGNHENIADAFAAALLMPKEFLLREIARGCSQIEIAASLEVEPGMLQKRLEQLSIGQEQPQSFAAAEDLLANQQLQGVQRFAASGEAPKARPVPQDPNPEAKANKRGMERIREIAAQLGNRPLPK